MLGSSDSAPQNQAVPARFPISCADASLEGEGRVGQRRPARIDYGANQATLRAGANPTGMSATSFIVLISTTETLLVCSLAT
jgi:hypothetical protein